MVMNRLSSIGILGFTLLTYAVFPCGNNLSASENKAKPNIVFIMADDLGWGELGCYGNRFNETPNLNRLAKQGIRFTQAYSAAPVCSPTRASIMTGQYPARVGITDYLRPGDPNHLALSHVTLAEMLRQEGYATGIVGKWHLTGYRNHGAKEFPPSKHGFDEVMVSENRGIGGGSYFFPYHFNREIKQKLKDQNGKEYLVDRCNYEAVKFIERNKDRPFFLYLSHYAVHTRLAGKEDLVAKYLKKNGAGKGFRAKKNNPHLAAQLESIDQGVGRILAKLDEFGLTDNTIVIFTSDNGGQSQVTVNGLLRAGKSTLYEGGVRIPLIIRWPGKIPENSVSEVPVMTIDFYPTFAAMAGIQPDPKQHLDGISLLPLLVNPKAKLKRDALYWHYPLKKPHFLGGNSSGAIRVGDFKLIEYFTSGKLELFNLANDPSEKKNLLSFMPAKAKELHRRLQRWRAEVNAKIFKHRPGKKNKKKAKAK